MFKTERKQVEAYLNYRPAPGTLVVKDNYFPAESLVELAGKTNKLVLGFKLGNIDYLEFLSAYDSAKTKEDRSSKLILSFPSLEVPQILYQQLEEMLGKNWKNHIFETIENSYDAFMIWNECVLEYLHLLEVSTDEYQPVVELSFGYVNEGSTLYPDFIGEYVLFPNISSNLNDFIPRMVEKYGLVETEKKQLEASKKILDLFVGRTKEKQVDIPRIAQSMFKDQS